MVAVDRGGRKPPGDNEVVRNAPGARLVLLVPFIAQFDGSPREELARKAADAEGRVAGVIGNQLALTFKFDSDGL